MRRLDDTPIDPEIEAYLDVIDATLAGEPVDPEQAELAELVVMVASERPSPRAGFSEALDARVGRRFAPESADGAGGGAAPPPRPGMWARLFDTPWRTGGFAVAGV